MMINLDEAQSLMEKFIQLRAKYKETGLEKDEKIFREHERICIEKFKYIVSMHTDKYKGFFNYEDLNQEGSEAMLKAMKNYNPKLGSWFYWCHQYVKTRISRCANLHTTIRYPLKYTKIYAPHKESKLPVMIEKSCPDKSLESVEVLAAIKNGMKSLNRKQKQVVSLALGFDGDKPLSINKICKKMNISRVNCVELLDNALNLLKENIHL
jgi:RNA polymerase sigma factor (sigma-70 family)